MAKNIVDFVADCSRCGKPIKIFTADGPGGSAVLPVSKVDTFEGECKHCFKLNVFSVKIQVIVKREE